MENLEVVQYRCPNCNAALNFEIERQGFLCEYCSSFFTQPQLKEIYREKEEHELDVQESVEAQNAANSEFAEYNSVYSCPGCGAAIITSSIDKATSICHYCHSPVILTGRLSGDYKPDYIIPFKTTKEDALRNFDMWCKKKRFLVSGFRGAQAIQNMNALYVPYWLYDCSADAKIQTNCKQVRIERRGSNRVSHIKEYFCHRRANMSFVRVPVDGSIRIQDEAMAQIEPFNYKEMEKFSMSFLSGMDAEKYNVDKNQAIPIVRSKVIQACQDVIVEGLKKEYQNVSVASAEVGIGDDKFSYALLPVWFMNFTFKGKDYYYAMNGQTGKFCGRLPLSMLKLNLLTFGIIAMLLTFFFGFIALTF